MDAQHRDEIQRQMAMLRAALARDVSGSIDSAKLLADWHYHFRKHPALFCGAAALVGYTLIPSRRAPPVAVQTTPPQAVQRAEASSLAEALVTMAVKTLASHAIDALSRHSRDWLAQVLEPSESQPADSWSSSATSTEGLEL